MELVEIFRIIQSRKLVALAIVALAVLAGVGAKLATRSVPKGAATVQILVDSPNSALANLVQNTVPLTARASVFAQVMASQAVLEDIGQAASIPVSQMTAEGPYSGSGEKLDVVTPSEARGTQLLSQEAKYKLTFLAQENEPLITASVQAPTAAAAAQLAGGVYPGVVHYVATLQKSMNTPTAQRVTIRELGPPQAGTVSSGAGLTVVVAAAFGVLLLGGLILVGVEGVRRQAHAAESLERGLAVDFDAAVLAEGFDGVAAAGVGGRSAAGVRAGNGNGYARVGERPVAPSAESMQRDPDRTVSQAVGERD